LIRSRTRAVLQPLVGRQRALLGQEKNDMTTMDDLHHVHRVCRALRFLRWVCAACLAVAVFAPEAHADGELAWATAMISPGHNEGHGIAVDAAGNVYTTGGFGGTVDFDPGPVTFNLTSAGVGNIFVSKLDRNGNLVWARAMGGTGFGRALDIAVDAQGNVYTTGFFVGTADFDPGPDSFNLTAVGRDDIFVSKLDANGDFVWARAMGGENDCSGRSIAVDEGGNVYTTGKFEGMVDFDPDPGSSYLASVEGNGIFVSKLDANGDFVWASAMGGTILASGDGIAVDAAGNVYTTGAFFGTADFDPGPGLFNLTSADSTDIFISKLDANGDFVWARAMGGTRDNWGYDIAVDDAGNLYTTGIFQGTADFDPGSESFNLTSAGTVDIFVSKLDTNGDFVWARAMGGRGVAISNAISVDAAGNVYTAGLFESTADFDPGPDSFNITAEGGIDTFVSKLDTNGEFVWARGMGGTSITQGNGIAVDAAGNVYATGGFFGTVNFDPGPDYFSFTSEGNVDIFIVKLSGPATQADVDFAWARAMGSTVTSIGRDIAVDDAGNVYTTGNFTHTADFDPGPDSFTVTSAGGDDIFVSKLDTNGDFVWARAMGGTSNSYGDGIALDPLGNVYTTGSFQGTADFDPGPESFTFTSAGMRDIFVSKLDANGDFVWARAMSGASSNQGLGIAVDASGNASVTGLFGGRADFGPFELVSGIFTDIFVTKLNADGEFAWAHALAGTGFSAGHRIAVDNAGNAYTTGWFRGSAAFGPFTLDPSGPDDIFVCKQDTDGNVVWARAMGSGERNDAYGIAVDPAGNTYVTGSFEGTATFGPFQITSVQQRDIFVTKLDADGEFVWARAMGGTGFNEGRGIAVDDAGNVYTTGSFQGEADFDPGLGVFALTSEEDSSDIFVSKLDTNGDFVWARAATGPANNVALGIAVNGEDNVYVTGNFSGTVDFDPGPESFELTSSGGRDIFILKLSRSALAADINRDGVVNAVDVQLVINAALGIDIGGLNADVNGDGFVNAVDVQLVINAALGIAIDP